MTNTARDHWPDESALDTRSDAHAGAAARAPGRLRAVPMPPSAAPPARSVDPERAFAPGFLRAVVIGGFVGFIVVAALAGAAIGLLTPYGAAAAVGVGAFVGAFGGVGFGAMVAASVHG
jgi:hypothetical protein